MFAKIYLNSYKPELNPIFMANLKKLALETMLAAVIAISPSCSDNSQVRESLDSTYKDIENKIVIARQRKFFNPTKDKYLIFEEIRDERNKDKWYLHRVMNANEELLNELAKKLPKLTSYIKQSKSLKEIELEDIYEKGKLIKIRVYLLDNKVEEFPIQH